MSFSHLAQLVLSPPLPLVHEGDLICYGLPWAHRSCRTNEIQENKGLVGTMDWFQIGNVFPEAETVKNLPATQETWVRSLGQEDPLGKGTGSPLQYSCLENAMDRGAWRATVLGVTKSRT